METTHPFTPDLTEAHLAMLDRLAQHGMGFADLIAAEAERAAAGPAPNQPSLLELGRLFTRISHAVRQTLYLRAKLAQYLATPPARLKANPPAAVIIEAEPNPAQPEPTETGLEPEPESLRQDLAERLDRPDYTTGFRHQSFAEIVAGICQDLGISPHSQSWPSDLMASTSPSASRTGAPPFSHTPPPPSTGCPPDTPPPFG